MKTPKKYVVTEIPNNDGLFQVLVYDSEIQDYRALAFDVMKQDAHKIVRAMTAYEKRSK